jgi:hypothetical protein
MTQKEATHLCERSRKSEAGGDELRKEGEVQEQLTTSEESRKRFEELKQQFAAF